VISPPRKKTQLPSHWLWSGYKHEQVENLVYNELTVVAII